MKIKKPPAGLGVSRHRGQAKQLNTIILDSALRLHDIKLPIVPCAGKKPIWTEWQKAPRSREELEAALSNCRPLNIAIVLNLCGLVDIECDSAEAEAELLEICGGTIPPCPTWKSPRGKHRLFLRPKGLPKKAVVHVGQIECRLGNDSKGACSVVPPSEGREWLAGLSIDQIFPAKLPAPLIDRLRDAAGPRRHHDANDGDAIPEGRRNETLFAMACAMRRHGAGNNAIEAALTAENGRRCRPPLPQSEIWNIARSAVAYDGGGEFAQLINLLEPPPLLPAAYHGFLGELVDAVRPYTEACDVAILAQGLAITGCLAGDKPTIYAGCLQPARMNIALAGPTSSGRKGTSLSILDRTLRKLPFHPTTQLWKSQCMRGLSSGEGLIKAVADRKEKNEETGEWENVEVEKRAFIIEPELSKILAHAKREGNILTHIIREAFDSGHLQTLVVQNPLRADRAHVVICGHITPEELRSKLTTLDMANGFANRFLWIYVNSDKELPDAGPIPNELMVRLAKTWCDILKVIPEFNEVTRDDEAAELWRAIYPSLRATKPGLRGALTARGETIVIRLALIYALLDRSNKIRRVHLEAALALWQYGTESVQLLFPDKTGSSLADRLFALLAEGPLTKREMYRHFQEPADVLNAALAELEATGRVRMTRKRHPGPGRPAELWERVGPRQTN